MKSIATATPAYLLAIISPWCLCQIQELFVYMDANHDGTLELNEVSEEQHVPAVSRLNTG